ncbi:MAG: SctK family type III secretion system sorting platform protein [Thiolinea sp.]
MDSQEESVNRNKLSDLVWEFNFRPDHYIHDSWLEQMPDGPLIKKLGGCHRSADRIVQYLMQRLDLEGQVFFNFSNSLTRIGLWSGADLERLIMHAGAVFYHSKVQRVVAREDVLHIRDQMGDELFSFMQRRALQLKGRMELSLKLPRELDAEKAIILAGLLCFHVALSDYPLALRKRLMLKLPHQWFTLYKRAAPLGKQLSQKQSECAALLQKVAIEVRIGIGRDGQIHFS